MVISLSQVRALAVLSATAASVSPKSPSTRGTWVSVDTTIDAVDSDYQGHRLLVQRLVSELAEATIEAEATAEAAKAARKAAFDKLLQVLRLLRGYRKKFHLHYWHVLGNRVHDQLLHSLTAASCSPPSQPLSPERLLAAA